MHNGKNYAKSKMLNNKWSNGVFLILGIFLLSTQAHANLVWDADTLNSYSGNFTSMNLKSVNGSVEKTISASQLRVWIEVRDRISSESGTYTKLLFTDQPILNAWAQSSNGANTVTVTFQMLDMIGDDSDQCAALMGHEITHLAKNHGLQKTAVNSVLSILGSLAATALDAKLHTNGAGADIATLGAGILSSSFSRDEEREADEYGFKWMTQAGYDPEGNIRLHTALLEHGGDNNSFLSSHPSSSERIATMRGYIDQYKATKNTQLARAQNPNIQRSPDQQTYTSKVDYKPPVVEPTVDVKGQVGVTLTLKSRYNYLIFSGTTATKLPEGLKIQVVTKDSHKIPARIARSVEGYYSAVIDGDIKSIGVGDSIEIGEN